VDTNNSSEHQPIEAPSGLDLHPQPQKAVRISRRASMAIMSVIVLLLLAFAYGGYRRTLTNPLLATPAFPGMSLRRLRRAQSSCRQLRRAPCRVPAVMGMNSTRPIHLYPLRRHPAALILRPASLIVSILKPVNSAMAFPKSESLYGNRTR
jgi:hypothetical protein